MRKDPEGITCVDCAWGRVSDSVPTAHRRCNRRRSGEEPEGKIILHGNPHRTLYMSPELLSSRRRHGTLTTKDRLLARTERPPEQRSRRTSAVWGKALVRRRRWLTTEEELPHEAYVTRARQLWQASSLLIFSDPPEDASPRDGHSVPEVHREVVGMVLAW